MLFNVRSAYSLLNSTNQIQRYVEKAKDRGYQALGLADENVLHGAVEFYQACLKQDLKPMIGMTIQMPGLIDERQAYPLILHALNYQGYLALIKISRLVNAATVSRQEILGQIENNKTNLVAITPGRQGEVEQAIIHNKKDQLEHLLMDWQFLIDQNNFYIGIPIYPYNEVEIHDLIAVAQHYRLPTAVNQLIETIDSEEAFALKILQAIEAGETLDPSVSSYRGAHYLYWSNELIEMYQNQGLDQVLKHSQDLIQRIKLEIPLHQTLLPKFNPPENFQAGDYLRHLTFEKLKQLELENHPDYIQRLQHELDVIETMGFIDYFLIVWEIIAYCHTNKIRTGPGRGSAAGSLVAYLLDITRVDPIEYQLLFERFLNPERQNMPDIDIDIPDDKRDQVLLYIEKKYGHEQVAQMITFGSFGAKQAIRDTLRVLGQTRPEQDRWARAIPNELGITLEKAYKKSAALESIVKESNLNQQVFQTALQIEGLPRHSSTHASGVVISDQDLTDLIPVLERPDQLLITQYAMDEIETIGLLKMDFLGLRNLQVLDDVLLAIKRRHQKEIDIETINMNDPQTLALFARAETEGVFQFESKGIRRVLKQLKPDSFEDIIAVNALYRPGPMDQIPTFIKRKHGQEAIEYLHPSLEGILKNTYGVIVYQEQVMLICQQLAGYTLGQADLLRRAIGKKQRDIMKEERSRFIQGAFENGIDQQTAAEIFAYIEKFANYGFNRAHAAVYSTLAFQLAYLKVHYPLEFYLVLLNQGRSLHQSEEDYSRAAKIEIGKFLPVDINYSQANFSIDQAKIRIGFKSIKGLSGDFIETVINERSLAGPFTDLKNLLSRLPDKFLKESHFQALIETGALDTFGYNRATLMENLSTMLQHQKISGNHISLLQEIEPKIEIVREWPRRERIKREQEALGYQLAGHPMDDYMQLIEQDRHYELIESILNLSRKQTVLLIAYIASIRVIETRKQKQLMAFLDLTDSQHKISAVAFPQTYQHYQNLIQDGTIVEIRGRFEFNKQGEPQIIIDTIKEPPALNEAGQTNNQSPKKTLFIRYHKDQFTQEKFDYLKETALANPGPASVILVDQNKSTFQLAPQYNIATSNRLIEELKGFFGYDNVVLR